MPKLSMLVAPPIDSRTNDVTKDSKMVNCYLEQTGQTVHAVKRPGKKAYTLSTPLTAPGQGLWNYNGNLYAAAGGYLTSITGGTVTPIGNGYSSTNTFSFVNTLSTSAPHPYMVFHDQVNGYYLDANNNLVNIATQVNIVSLNSGGSGYPTSGGTFTVTGSGGGSTATGTYTTYNGSIVNVVLTNPGFNLSGTLTVNFSGTIAVGTASIASTTMTVTANTTFGFYPGMLLTGTGVSANSVLGSQLTSTDTPAATTTFVSGGHSNSTTMVISSVTNVAINQLVAGTGIPSGTIVTAISGTTITLSNSLTTQAAGTYNFYNQGGNGTYSVSPSQTVASTTITGTVAVPAGATANFNSFPSNPVPGLVYLDGYVFAMDNTATIWQSDLENPSSWGALNYVRAGGDSDGGVAICRHLNYLVCFKQWSTQFFFDAANPIGSVLQVNPSATLEIGCAHGGSVQQLEESVIWMATVKEGGRAVMMMDGLTPMPVSNKAVEEYLNASNLNTVYSWIYRISGHTFYGLVLQDQNVTLVFDISTQQWAFWTTNKQFIGGTENYFECSFVTQFPFGSQQFYVLDAVNGLVFKLDEKNYVDPFGPVTMRIVTPRNDYGTYDQKTVPCLTVFADNINDTMQVRHSDDDYQTWSGYRNIDLSLQKPCIYNTGRFRRRAWEFLYTGNNPLRVFKVELDVNGAVLSPQ